MNKEYIEIEKDLIPYRFETELGAELFEFEVHYNAHGDYFTVDLFKDGEVLVHGEKIVYGQSLFSEIYDERFPAPEIIPIDESGKETRVGWDNLNKTVFLVVDNDG
ncbi:phage baseplate plug family protein [Lysinibacillus sp. 54212]|uniref:phage baseplate plug family protein n=1 Tax=Lysinibacillus sp. 54212 TaxID=3119829 RepID=UPI002FC9FDD2